MSNSSPRRRGFHFIPFAAKRTDQVTANVTSLLIALQPWIDRTRTAIGAVVPSLEDPDEIRVHVAGAMMRAPEWDGFILARELSLVSQWPADAELVQVLHRWSCDLRGSEIKAYYARKQGGQR